MSSTVSLQKRVAFSQLLKFDTDICSPLHGIKSQSPLAACKGSPIPKLPAFSASVSQMSLPLSFQDETYAQNIMR